VPARENGRVDLERLSSTFKVSAQTIRKDLNELCDRQLLQRIHGGAIVGSGVENVSPGIIFVYSNIFFRLIIN
jgi:DeoR family glycerol-3-phosphate regulon repressor